MLCRLFIASKGNFPDVVVRATYKMKSLEINLDQEWDPWSGV